MRSAVNLEFETVEILLSSDTKTRAVDAFAISWVKLERQRRRLTGNLIFQHTSFVDKNLEHQNAIRKAILEKRTGNHKRFIGAIRKLTNVSVGELIGEPYRVLKRDIAQSYVHRNKILHGQQAGQSLSRLDIEASIKSIRNWCELLATGSAERFGYDGFSRNSLVKTNRQDIVVAVDRALGEGWKEFVQQI